MEGFLVCAHCGQTFAEFQKGGLLGCPACYLAFEGELARLFHRLHGACRHCVEPSDQAVLELELKLKDAVRREAYEEAVALRDLISTLKAQIHIGHDV